MKQISLAILPWLFPLMGYKAMAQDEQAPKARNHESEEIIIRKKGDKDVNIRLEITGDKVLINGKALVEFKDDNITVNKRKVIIRDNDGRSRFMFDDFPGKIEIENFDVDGFKWNSPNAEKKAFLGVTTEKADAGAKILSVTKGSAAEKAGLTEGDIITKIDGQELNGPDQLSEIISAKKPKDVVKVHYKRNGKNKSEKITLGERETRSMARSFSFNGPDGSMKTFTIPAVPGMPGNGRWMERFPDQGLERLGEGLDRLDRELVTVGSPRKPRLGLRIQDTEESKGVKVLDVEAESPAATAGIKSDDIITEIAGVKVTNTDEAREQLRENSEKSSYTIKALRNGTEMSFPVKIPKKLKTANL